MRHLESALQIQLFHWANMMRQSLPELQLMFHIPNGGARTKIEGARLKREGVKAGVPDIFLPVARGKYHGLFIELKTGKGKPSKSQAEWVLSLTDQGYGAMVINSFDDARKIITWYLEQENG